MRIMHTFIVLAATSTTTKKSSSSSSSLTFLLLIVALAAVYFLFLRPRSQRAKQQRQQQATAFGVGDEVQTIGGIRGIVVAIEDDDVEVQVAPDTVLTFVKQAVRPRPDAASNPSSRPASTSSTATPEPEEDDWPMPEGFSPDHQDNAKGNSTGQGGSGVEGQEGGPTTARGQD
jgi:preprotein translocase subunit YajC